MTEKGSCTANSPPGRTWAGAHGAGPDPQRPGIYLGGSGTGRGEANAVAWRVGLLDPVGRDRGETARASRPVAGGLELLVAGQFIYPRRAANGARNLGSA